MSLKKYQTPLLIGGALIGGALLFNMMFRKKVEGEFRNIEHEFIPSMHAGGHPPVARANYASKIGYRNRANPGVDDLDNWVNQTAAGHNAGLDPSEYSYLTQQNRNPLLSTLKNIPLMGQGHRDFEHIRFQGSFGLTGPPGQGFNTFF